MLKWENSGKQNEKRRNLRGKGRLARGRLLPSKLQKLPLAAHTPTSSLQRRALTRWLITNFSRNVPAVEAEASSDIQAIHRLLSVVALRRRDVDGSWEEDGDVHRNDGSRPTGQERKLSEPNEN